MPEKRPASGGIRQALTHLEQVDSTLPVRYARIFLREASAAADPSDEARLLARAENELARAVLASAAPAYDLAQAWSHTVKARSEATD